jgi:endonuclease/exonuclease/phosphatase family metal-dependent hydrolase
MSLRLGTFNVWGLPEIFGVGDDVTARTREIARRLRGSDLDVLMIQEAWTEPVRRTLRAGAELAGFRVADAGGGGLMTFSRPRILDQGFTRYRFRGDPERIDQGEFIGGKGFQTLEIEHGGERLRIVNTHLHARYRKAQPRLNAAVRVAQLMQLVGYLAETPGNVVVGGDFNCAAGDLEYEIFRGLSGATELGGGSRHPTLSRANYYKRHRTAADKRIDFLFVRPAAGAKWRGEDARLLFAERAEIRQIHRSLSDHFGFRAALVPGPTSAAPTHAFAAGTSPDPGAIQLARQLLDEGDVAARDRLDGQVGRAWVFAGVALAAGGARRTRAVDRRRFLRGGLILATWLAIPPAAGYTALAHFDGEGKRSAFDEAREVLSSLAARVERERARPGDASGSGSANV